MRPDEGTEPERRNAAQRPACMKLPDYVAEDPDRAGGAHQPSSVVPQLELAVGIGNIEAPNPHMVEDKRKAK